MKKHNSDPLKLLKKAHFDTLVFSNIDFTENLSGGKILEFQHCTKK